MSLEDDFIALTDENDRLLDENHRLWEENNELKLQLRKEEKDGNRQLETKTRIIPKDL